MSKYVIDSSTLTAIGDAVRGKDGSTDPILVSEIASRITDIPAGSGGYDIPDDAFVFSGNCTYRFAYNGWNWFIEQFKNKIIFNNISIPTSMFNNATELEEIPIDFITNGSDKIDFNNLFFNCNSLKIVGDIKNYNIRTLNQTFYNCYNLRELPNFIDCSFDDMHTYTSSTGACFQNCYSLRNIPEDLLKNIYSKATGTYNSPFSNTFYQCFTLDEIRGLNSNADAIWTSNMFGSAFNNCSRVKDIIFATQEDGTPYVRSWKSQIIDLSGYDSSKGGIGFTVIVSDKGVYYNKYINNYNSGITIDKAVYDDATYQALKDDPDWFGPLVYSRYNHDSAVNTLNSLPDTMEYVTAQSGTNTIKFKGTAGSATDGGAINTLTEEEIAVAAAKGWTVTLV